jgi:hypothetical protein
VLATRPDLPSITTKIKILCLMWDRWNFAFRVRKVTPHTYNKIHGWLTHFCGILALNSTQAHAQKGETITGDYQPKKTTNKIHEFLIKQFKYPISEKSTLRLCDTTEYAWNYPKTNFRSVARWNFHSRRVVSGRPVLHLINDTQIILKN